MRESTVEAHLVRRVKALGGEVRKVQWIGRRGAPDRIVMLPYSTEWAKRGWVHRGGTVSWVELKRPGKDAEEHQAREHERMRKMGQHVVVLDSIEAVDKFLEGVN
jgi:hypothetical protein